MTQRLDFEGRSYTWEGGRWYDSRTRMVPPVSIVSKLNALLRPALQQEDESITSIDLLLSRARQARDSMQESRAEALGRRVLRLSPGHIGAVTILSSVLRERNQPERALAETEGFRSTSYAPLLTTRAAALCDLGRWEEAKREIGRALAVKASVEAFGVVHRIKAARPDLYE